jgi:prepilin-type N-terminal cleavage/methylation domain-containing protein
MKHTPPSSQWHHFLNWLQQRFKSRRSTQFRRNQGFTLIELLVASLLTSVVILIAWNGLISALNMSQVAEARTTRQSELNKALDFMTNEIRTARSINQSGSVAANGTTVSLEDVVTHAGINLAALGNYGTIGLYLEKPTSSNIPATCPAGGPNAGSPPPTPANYDSIVYDIRSSPSGWLQPQMLARYGRVPSSDGTINPCSSPVSSDPMVDALSTSMKTTPTCTGGVLSGAGGFYSCAVGKQVNLFFQSDVSSAETRQVNSAASSRVLDLNPTQGELTLDMNVSGGVANLTWNWSGNPPAVTSYTVHKTWQGNEYTPYTGSNLSFSYNLNNFASPGDDICFWVVAQTSAGSIRSSQSCTVY